MCGAIKHVTTPWGEVSCEEIGVATPSAWAYARAVDACSVEALARAGRVLHLGRCSAGGPHRRGERTAGSSPFAMAAAHEAK
eukprot:4057837-Pleurochrysis_carterae.AAC.1